MISIEYDKSRIEYFINKEKREARTRVAYRKEYDNDNKIVIKNSYSSLINNETEFYEFDVMNGCNNISLFHTIEQTKLTIKKNDSTLNDIRLQNLLKVVVSSNDLSVVVSDYFCPSYTDYSTIVNYIDKMDKRCSKIVELRNENQMNLLKSNIKIKFINGTAGVLFHELIGHLLESDIAQYNTELLDTLRSKQFHDDLTIVDQINGFDNIVGLNEYDDLGNLSVKYNMILNGKVNSENYGANDLMDNKFGNSIAHNIYDQPYPRMRGMKIISSNRRKDLINEFLNSKNNELLALSLESGQCLFHLGDYNIVGDFIYKEDNSFYYIHLGSINGTIANTLSNINFISNNTTRKIKECSKNQQIVFVGMDSPDIKVSDITFTGNAILLKEAEVCKIMKTYF